MNFKKNHLGKMTMKSNFKILRCRITSSVTRKRAEMYNGILSIGYIYIRYIRLGCQIPSASLVFPALQSCGIPFMFVRKNKHYSDLDLITITKCLLILTRRETIKMAEKL